MRFWGLNAHDIEVCSLQKFCQYVMKNSMRSISYDDELKNIYRDYNKMPVKININNDNLAFVSDYREFALDVIRKEYFDERKNIIAVRLSPRKWLLTNYINWSFIQYKDYLGNDYISLSKTKNKEEKVLFIERVKQVNPEESQILIDYVPKIFSYDLDSDSSDYFNNYLYQNP